MRSRCGGFRRRQGTGRLCVSSSRTRPDQRPDLAAGAPPAYGDNLMHRNTLDVQSRVGHAMLTLLMTDFLDDYADVPIHVANLGGTLPAVVERLDNLSMERTPDAPLPSTQLRKVHIDCSSFGPHTLELAAHFFGADLILLGTDCPIFRTDRSLAAIEAADLTAAEKDGVRHGQRGATFGRFMAALRAGIFSLG